MCLAVVVQSLLPRLETRPATGCSKRCHLRLSLNCLESRSKDMAGYEDSPAPRHEVLQGARQGADAEQANNEPPSARTQVAEGTCGGPRGVTWGRSPGDARGARGQPEVAVALRRSPGWQFPGLWRRAAAGVTRNTAAAARARRQRSDEEEAATSHAICATAHLPPATAGTEAPE